MSSRTPIRIAAWRRSLGGFAAQLGVAGFAAQLRLGRFAARLRLGRQPRPSLAGAILPAASVPASFWALPVLALAAVVLVAVAPLARAQYVGQVKTQANAPGLRAVAVLEWTGDLPHPKASRLIPITVYDGQELQDGGIYLARPQPLALDPEVEYQLQQDGRTVGLFDIQNAAQQQGSWIGFGLWKPLPTGPSPAELARLRNQKVDVDDYAGNDKPILHRKHHDDDSSSGSGNQGAAPDPDRPTLHRDGDAASSGSGSTSSTANNSDAPPPDPDRPVLRKDSGPADSTASNGSNSNGANSDGAGGSNGSAGPALHRPPDNEVASVSDLPNISDPGRPRLLRGGPVNYGPKEAPTLMGLPPEMNQEVAVSDTRNAPNHPWDFTWANPADEVKMKADMEDIARKALGLTPPPAPAGSAKHASAHKKTPPAPPQPAPLEDEQFRVLQLEYSAGATMVLSAHTAGSGPDEKFVTLIAQPDLYGSVIVLFKNVTDAAHLDAAPRMRLIDAVDALGDNRGELLFELRGKNQRQFALYRIYKGTATNIFTSGLDYIGAPAG